MHDLMYCIILLQRNAECSTPVYQAYDTMRSGVSVSCQREIENTNTNQTRDQFRVSPTVHADYFMRVSTRIIRRNMNSFGPSVGFPYQYTPAGGTF